MSRVQYDEFVKQIPNGVCTFCEWEKYQVVLKEFEHWVWIANLAPYWRYHTLIMPKRHFVKYGDMTFKEAGELTTVIDYGEKKMLDAKLTNGNGMIYEKIVYFWRYRFNNYDHVSKTLRPSHMHLHLTFDQDRLWDPVIDEEASKVDMSKLI